MTPDFKSFISSVSGAISAAVRKNPNASINVDELKEYADANIKMHTELARVIDSLPSSTRNEWIKDRLVTNLREDSTGIAESYDKYRRLLKGRAGTAESSSPLSTLSEINRNYINTLRSVNDFLTNEADPGEKIMPEDIRVSLVMVTTALANSNVVIRFTTLLVSSLVYLTVHDKIDYEIPKYRIEFLQSNVEAVADIVNESYSHGNKIDVISKIETVRQREGDFRVMEKSFYSGPGSSLIDSLATILGGVLNLVTKFINPILTIFMNGNGMLYWTSGKIERYEHDKETLEWLQRHTALLRLELNGTDPSNPRYAELKKIIAAYEERITEYDRAIAEYEREVNR